MDVSRYDFECQKALHTGLKQAKSLGHDRLEIEHVALGLLRSGEAPLNPVDSRKVRGAMERHLGRVPRLFGGAKISFGPRLDRALDHCEAHQQETIRLDELWQAMVRESSALQLALSGVRQDQADRENFRPLDGVSIPPAPTGGPSPGEKEPESPKKKDAGEASGLPRKQDKVLKKYTLDLTALAERGDLDPVIGRDGEVRRVMEILGRKKKNNPLLLGEPGVGKSAVAEAIALRISRGDVPESMQHRRVLSLDLGALLAGAKFRGEFEDRFKSLIRALSDLRDQVILFIDEIHMLIGTGNQEGGADAANLLKPALARGELRCLGATTLDEYRRYIEKDPALERRFQPVKVMEPSPAETLSILRGLKAGYEIHHGITVEDEALEAAVQLSVRYVADRRLPDKAIDLLDEAASKVRLNLDSVPAVIEGIRSKKNQLEIEKQALTDPAAQKSLARLKVELDRLEEEGGKLEALWQEHKDLRSGRTVLEKKLAELEELFASAGARGDFEFAARLRYMEIPDTRAKLREKSDALETMQRQHPWLGEVVGAGHIAEVVSTWTGVPTGRLLDDEAARLLSLEKRLATRVFGQDEALEVLSRAIRRNRVGISDPRRPQGVFLFLGPTGVGKTETARALAADLFGDENQMIRLDMSEYQEQHQVSRMLGAPPGYVGHGGGGELADRIRSRPWSLVLFDEVEKAHPAVLDILLQIFEDGRVTDGRGRVADFRQAILIMTSNVPVYQPAGQVAAAQRDEAIRTSLCQHFKPELVNRIDEVVRFSSLTSRHLEWLVERLVEELNGRLVEREMRISLGRTLVDQLVGTGHDGQFGGRAVRRAFQSMVVDQVSERILSRPDLARGAWILNLDEDHGYSWRSEQHTHRYLPASGSGS